MEGEGDLSDRGCDYKARACTTYNLKMKRKGGISGRDPDYKTKAGTTYSLDVAMSDPI